MNAQFNYDVKLTPGCELFNVEPLKSSLLNATELLITSKKFDSYTECYQNVADIISTFSSLLEQVTDERFVILSKLNPLHDPAVTDKTEISEVDWPKNVLLRAYAAKAKPLKEEHRLEFTIFATLYTHQDFLDQSFLRYSQ